MDINQKVLVKSIDAMLLDTFKMFTEVNKQTLQDEIEKATVKIEEYILLQKIRPSLIDCIQKSLTTEDTLKSINKITGIEESIISELINKYKISKLVTLNTDTSILTQKRKESTDNLNNLSTYVLQQYSGF